MAVNIITAIIVNLGRFIRFMRRFIRFQLTLSRYAIEYPTENVEQHRTLETY